MPRKYTYRKMNSPEFVKAMRAANMSVSDACKLLGRPYFTVKSYMGQNAERTETPTTLESIVMDFIAEYPEHLPVLLDIAEVRITGQVEPGGAR